MKIPETFYTDTNVLKIARKLIGKVLVTNMDGVITTGMITETEAYAGITDKASHAYGGRRTTRTEVMYARGGVAYVYLCYGIHHLFNVVTNIQDVPHAVLVRAIAPIEGIETMLTRRNKRKANSTLTAGPGSLSAALGINKQHTGTSLLGETIFIEDRGIKISAKEIVAKTRIGVDYAGNDALLPYRFYLRNSEYVSKY
ncbi:MAG: DNA-3-methyladenine glycosylase [Taibaiella sp.]|nr:DNA-3-methyladenine glycosylase [Taibaiella sp.]